MNLSDVTASFLAQFPDGTAGDLRKKEVLLERFGNIAFGGLGIVVLSGVGILIYWILTKMIVTGASAIAGVLLIAFILFAVLALAYVLMRESLTETKQKLTSRSIGLEIMSRHFEELSAGIPQEAISVVEDSTELLPVENRTTKLT